jgi:thiosulfate dehydrogenase (quinone) large subunit
VTRPTVPAVALLPIRLFFGATFLYAGVDKLLDPTFFDASAATSINAQLEGFARLSPLGGLIRASLPLAEPIGFLIAIAEIGIGIGALTGLAFRVAAIGGAVLSLLFVLTASWATHPYYIGADLPYATGWLALALAGHGDLLVPDAVRTAFGWWAAGNSRPATPLTERAMPARAMPASARSRRRRLATRQAAGCGGAVPLGYSPARRPAQEIRVAADAAGPADAPTSPERRLLLETGLLAGLAAIAASFALPLRALGVFTEPRNSGGTPLPLPGASPAAAASGAPTTTTAPGSTSASSNTVIARLGDLQQGGGAATFTVPFNAPPPLPAGDPGIVIELADGTFVAFDATCTHAGCTVQWDAQDGVLLCPCHDAAFDPAHGAAVLQGPARRPLASLPIVVDQASGTISLGS